MTLARGNDRHATSKIDVAQDDDLVSTRETTGTIASGNDEKGIQNTCADAVVRRSSRKRIASTRYHVDCFMQLHEDPASEERGSPRENVPRTPHEDRKDLVSNKKRPKSFDLSDEEYLPGQDIQNAEDHQEPSTSSCSSE